MEKMKAAILGVGRMGQAICYAMHKLGFEVAGMDSNERAADSFRKYIDGPDGVFYLTDQNNADKSMERAMVFEKPDIVISSLPYHQTEEIAYWCIDNGFRYCDLGGRVDVSKGINDYAKEKAVKSVFTDLGLAPGWVNILAERGYSKVHAEVDEVKMMVGGLPAIRVNPPLDYALTWSTDGLINEYKDDCEILLDGKVETVQGMEGREEVSFELMGYEKFEAFYTSGGASHTIKTMQERGVKNCNYKTIRYDGHRDVVRFLIRNAGLSDECLKFIFENGCPNSTGDIVLIKVQARAGELLWNKEIIIGYDKKFSAMQKATAFSVASVAAIMANGELEGNKDEHRDYWSQYPIALSYKDVPFDKFNENLGKLGVQT